MPVARSLPQLTLLTPASSKFVAPQLATLVDDVPVGDGWWYETKYDGYRMQAHAMNGRTRLLSRNGLDWTSKFPEIAQAIRRAFRTRHVVLDGEIVKNAKGSSSFHSLQSALSDESTSDTKFVVFDVLVDQGMDVRRFPLRERRRVLDDLLKRFRDGRRVVPSRILRGSGTDALKRACARGDEGIISKRVDRPYESGRSRAWLKTKCGRRQEFVVIGYSEPKGGRTGVGALLLGVYDGKRVLHYAGRVGTGFDDHELIALRRQLEALKVTTSPLGDGDATMGVRERKSVLWVKPTLVVEVSFSEWTPDGLLRHPVYQGLREDKKARQVRREGR